MRKEELQVLFQQAYRSAVKPVLQMCGVVNFNCAWNLEVWWFQVSFGSWRKGGE